MPKACAAYACNNRDTGVSAGISYHRLPLGDPKLLKEWIIKIRRQNLPVNRNTYICSDHFEETCFTRSLGGTRCLLKSGSVPTKFIFSADIKSRRDPKKRLTSSCSTVLSDDSSPLDCDSGDVDEFPSVHDQCEKHKHDLLDSIKKLTEEREKLMQLLKEKEKSVMSLTTQVNDFSTHCENLKQKISKMQFSVESVKDNQLLFKFYTGLESYEVFIMLFNFLGTCINDLNYWGTTRSEDYCGDKCGPPRKLSLENELFLTLVKLKVGMLECDIANRFDISQSHVSRIFTTWVRVLYLRFSSPEFDIWPSRNDIDCSMPDVFAEQYPTTRVIIDCTEIFIEKPQNPEAQQLTFSTYKNHNTLKALVGISPTGAITFVSKLYGGCISDREIVIQSGLIEKLQAGDSIMADRGFNIQDLLAGKGVKLNIPPYLKGKGQFSEPELLKTRKIASIRIHVERAIERIKNFHVFESFPSSMIDVADEIFLVCAMLCNFQPPLVK